MIKSLLGSTIIFTCCLSSASVDSFLGKAVLVQELGPNGETKNQYLDSFSMNPSNGKYTSVSPEIGSFGAFGICFNQDSSPCSHDVTSKGEFSRAMSITNGRKQIDAALIPSIQDFPISSTTTILSEDANSLTIQIEQKLMNGLGKNNNKFRISKVPKLSAVPHAFTVPDEDKSNRKDVKDVDSKYQNLALGVVQLSSRPDPESLLGNSSGSGTGYFVSADGLMMTNHHVIDDFKACMENLVCEVDFKQVMPDGSRRSFTASATLLVVSQPYDFALLKVNLPKDLIFSYFNLEKQKVGPELITFGYPGDLTDGNETRLTYSFGKLVGFHSRAYATSAYIYQGASGSPLLNLDTLNVVAILSNGAGNPIPGIGSPGLARPIMLIDAEFGLSDYISGSKLARVKSIIASIQNATATAQAIAGLASYTKEKTYMGLNTLKRLMVTHAVPEVRIAIMKGLEKMKVLVGTSEVEDALLESNPQISPTIFLPLH